MLVVTAIVALGAIRVFGPDYAQLQVADGAGSFLRIVGDQRDRYVMAGAADVVFAACYGLLALAIARAPLASRVGAGLVLVGAAFDEAENSLLIANVMAVGELSDGAVELMRAAGVAKFVAIATGTLLYVGAWVVERRAAGRAARS